jgi:hypothetical protein
MPVPADPDRPTVKLAAPPVPTEVGPVRVTTGAACAAVIQALIRRGSDLNHNDIAVLNFCTSRAISVLTKVGCRKKRGRNDRAACRAVENNRPYLAVCRSSTGSAALAMAASNRVWVRICSLCAFNSFEIA